MVHPRVCGELSGIVPAPSSCFGSSPRVWGTLPLFDSNQTRVRFIPACVGNSNKVDGEMSDNAVHPRVCGELLPVNSWMGW